MKKRKARLRPKSAPAKRKIKTPQRKSSRATSKQSDPIDALAGASAKALGLRIEPHWQKSIAFNLRLIMQHAALVDAFALPDEAEPSPVYHA
jgi:hypothetical protein